MPPVVLSSLERNFLREDHVAVDAALPSIIDAAKARGAAECWHKHSSFLSHLLGVHRIATLWKLPRDVCLMALLHSAFSNSFVNLALWSPDSAGRAALCDLLREAAPADADAAEAWTWLFCSVPRHELVYTRLVDVLVYGIEANKAAPEGATPQSLLGWRDDPPNYVLPLDEATGQLVPPVRDIRSGEAIPLDAYQIGTLLALSVADFAEQWHAWQDALFGTEADGGRMRYGEAIGSAHALWPGDGSPGLFLHTLSHVCALVRACNASLERRGDSRSVPLPNLFAGCTRVVSAAQQAACAAHYWAAATVFWRGATDEEAASATDEVSRAIESCPFVGEPFVLRAQLRMQSTPPDWAGAADDAASGLRLLLDWGTCWDKARFRFFPSLLACSIEPS